MKIALEVNWADDHGNIDRTIKNAVVDRIAQTVSTELYPSIEAEVAERLADMVDALLNKLIDRFMNREIKVTDKWGDVTAEFESVEELLKTKFDDFLTQKVDKEGKATDSCGYRSRYTRLEWVVDERIKKHQDSITQTIGAQMDEKLEAEKEAFLARAGKQLAEKLGLSPEELAK